MILSAAEADFLGMLHGVDAVTALDALTHGGHVVLIGLFLSQNEVYAGLVESRATGSNEARMPMSFNATGVGLPLQSQSMLMLFMTLI